MILVLNKDISPQQDARLTAYLEGLGLTATRQLCQGKTILLLSGQTDRADAGILSSLPMVESVLPLADPLPLASRRSHPADTVVQVGDVFIGGGHFCLMAGPCTVESEEQLLSIARSVQAAGAQLLRGGAYKPRTSPYSFSGLREEGLALLRTARRETGLPVVSEIMSATDLPLFEDVDILQVGARNMQNYDLLRALGRCRKPVLLKRGPAATVQELLLSAEYILSGGNENVILCERGIRTFEHLIRNNLDISAVPLIKKHSHLPILIDPSHAAGIAWMVEPLAKAAIAAGADGLMIEVHNNPKEALCDGAQSLNMDQFADVMKEVKRRAAFEGKITD